MRKFFDAPAFGAPEEQDPKCIVLDTFVHPELACATEFADALQAAQYHAFQDYSRCRRYS